MSRATACRTEPARSDRRGPCPGRTRRTRCIRHQTGPNLAGITLYQPGARRPPHLDAVQGLLERRGEMTTKAVLDSETEPVVNAFDGTVPAPRPGARLRSPAASIVADLAAERFRAYRGGDARALDAMVESLTPLLWHIVRAYGLDTATAEDVVQNTWLTLVRKSDPVAEPQAVLRWLTVTARRDAWRAARAAKRMDLTDDDTVLDVRGTQSSPEDDAVRAADDRTL